MVNSHPKLEKPSPAEVSESTAGSIDTVATRLLRWGRIAPSGLARVEYISDTSQMAALERLRNGFELTDIPFVEIALPRHKSASEQVRFLRMRLAQIESGVVSITGFAHAFSEDTPLLESLRILNFNRENLADYPLSQIWWMPRDFTQMFRQSIPDLNSWFITKLRLDEIIAPLNVIHRPIKGTTSFTMSHEEGANASNFYATRFRVALQRKMDIDTLWQLWVDAVDPLLNVGRTNEAVHLQEALLQEASENGVEMREYLTSEHLRAELLGDIGTIYFQEGQYTKAEPLYRQALEMNRVAHPEGHFDVATSLNNMAELYSCQGRHVEAKPLLVEALQISREALPKGHPDITASLENLAEWHENQDDYFEAELLYKEVLEISRAVLPKGHPNLAAILTSLALLYDRQGRYTEAEPLFKEALEIGRAMLPEGHPRIAASLINLAGLYTLQGRYSEAETLYKEALAINRAILPSGDPEIAASLNNLALLYDSQNRQTEALHQMKEALDILTVNPGSEHPDTMTVATNYAALLEQNTTKV